jgi:hypothetical protein
MAKAAPKRSDFPSGMMGQAKYEAALKRYKASYGPPAPKPPKPVVNRRGRMVSPYKDGQIVTKEGNQFRYNAKTKQFTLVKKPAASKPAASKPAPSKPAVTTTPAAKPKKAGVAPVQPKPKPKPKPAMSAAAKGYQKDLADIKKVEKKAAAFKAAQERKKELAKLREEAKQKSLKIGRANRSRRNTTARGPRDR